MRDPLEDLLESRPLGQASQFPGEVLLKRLAPRLRPALELDVDFVGKVSDQHTRHACIMLS